MDATCKILLVVLIGTELYAVQLQVPSIEPDFVYKSFRLSSDSLLCLCTEVYKTYLLLTSATYVS